MPQSILATGSPQAEALAQLWWVLLWVCLAVLVAVVVVLGIALSGRRRGSPGGWLIAGGTVFSAFVLTGLLVTSSMVGAGLTVPQITPLRIDVVGKEWWWEVRYPGSNAVLANEIRLPVGRPVEIAASSDNVIHSFWVPGLAGKLDMVPGHPGVLAFTPSATGRWRGQCAEFCGTQHALMAFVVVVEEPAAFQSWLDRQSQPAIVGKGRGPELFLGSGCGACHTIRGTPANGTMGPDLTHVGSRVTIAAGTLPRNIGTLGGWIANSQAIKPGNRMPVFDQFSGEDLRALAAWLEGLE